MVGGGGCGEVSFKLRSEWQCGKLRPPIRQTEQLQKVLGGMNLVLGVGEADC